MARRPPIEARVAAKVRACRDRLGLSQLDLARLAGTSRSQVAAVERGDRAPTVRTLQALAQALRVPLVDLVADADDAPAPVPDRADALATKLRGRSGPFLDVVEALISALDRADRSRTADRGPPRRT